jgi:hypothetical protein
MSKQKDDHVTKITDKEIFIQALKEEKQDLERKMIT